jgi:hypothetical protein
VLLAFLVGYDLTLNVRVSVAVVSPAAFVGDGKKGISFVLPELAGIMGVTLGKFANNPNVDFEA